MRLLCFVSGLNLAMSVTGFIVGNFYIGAVNCAVGLFTGYLGFWGKE